MTLAVGVGWAQDRDGNGIMIAMGESDDVAEAREVATRFDEFVAAVAAEKRERAGLPVSIRLDVIEPMVRWNIGLFVDEFLRGSRYPVARLPEVARRLADLVLQFMSISVALGLANEHFYAHHPDTDTRTASPRLRLLKLALDQDVIGKTRVLWERLMNLVHLLEAGEPLDGRGRRSKKTTFFRWADDHDQWRWLCPYERTISDYDDRFRTPEFHKGSILRAELLGTRDPIDPNELLGPVNLVLSCVYDNLVAIVSEGKPTCFADVHMSGGDIDPRYRG